MPELHRPGQRARIEGYGARLVVGGAAYDEARQASEARAAETGALQVHAYDQDTCSPARARWRWNSPRTRRTSTHVLVATGGGGLIGGMAAWYAGSGTQVISVEPEGCPTLATALRAAARCRRRSAAWRPTASAPARSAR